MRPGFTLIECVLYMACCAVGAWLFSLWALYLVRELQHVTKNIESVMQLFQFQERLAMDLSVSRKEKIIWDTMSPTACRWHTKEGGWYQWEYVQKTVKRSRGGLGKRPEITVAAHAVDACQFQYHGQAASLIAITATACKSGQTLTRCIACALL
jgi:hypothetical protein